LSTKRVGVTPETYLETLDLYLQHQSTRRVAEILRVHRDTVINRLNHLGVKRPQERGSAVEAVNPPGHLEAVRQDLLTQIERGDQQSRLLSADDYLRTLELYLEHQSTVKVGAILGISARSASIRLVAMGVKPRATSAHQRAQDFNDPDHLVALLQRLAEGDLGDLARSDRRWRSTRSAAETLQIVELYLELQNINKVAKRVGLSPSTVSDRLSRLGFTLKPKGRYGASVQDLNGREFIEGVLATLRAQVAREQEQP
jgi:transposase